MILWPAAMTATLILSGHIVPALVDPLFTGLSLIWAIIGFEVVIRVYDSSDHPNQELRLGKAVWIANLPSSSLWDLPEWLRSQSRLELYPGSGCGTSCSISGC
jgi:hypothetical protein